MRIKLEGKSQDADLAAGETRQIMFALGNGFPYIDKDDGKPRFVWNASVSSSAGFVPLFVEGGDDTRFLGVHGPAEAGGIATAFSCQLSARSPS